MREWDKRLIKEAEKEKILKEWIHILVVIKRID